MYLCACVCDVCSRERGRRPELLFTGKLLVICRRGGYGSWQLLNGCGVPRSAAPLDLTLVLEPSTFRVFSDRRFPHLSYFPCWTVSVVEIDGWWG